MHPRATRPEEIRDAFIEAARVPATLRPQGFGLWAIERWNVPPDSYLAGAEDDDERMRPAGFPSVTLLRRWTMGTLHRHGEVVMEDSRPELEQHLPIWLAARGRVLVTGLGLGCVVRGLLASPRVEHVDVVEIDAGILRVVGPEFEGNARVTLHHADALTWEPPEGARWDYAWHDIHSDDGHGALQVLHARLLVRYAACCGRQGAWKLPRFAKRRIPRVLA